MTSEKKNSAPLAGYRVIDLTTFLSGPFCTQVLADLGAEVVKIEAPSGDSSRSIPPHFVDADSAYYLGVNRNKSSVVVDMKLPQGVALVLDLIRRSDIVVENFRPGVAARLGLDVDALRKENPDLIWASISGFGQDGPEKDKPAYDMIVQALSGVMSLTGEAGRPAVRLGIPAGDIVAGMYAVIAINAALADRERGHGGRVIDIAMLDCQLAMLSYQSTYALVAGVTPQPQGARHDSIPTYRSFAGSDQRELVVTANTERMWRGLCRALSCEPLADDPRFINGAQRLHNREALWGLLEAAFLARPAEQWVDLLQKNDVPAALIKTVPEALSDARISERDMIARLTSASGASIEVVGNPIKFTGERAAPADYPPALGENTESVLRKWLGMQSESIQALREAGALAPAGKAESTAAH